MNSSWSQVVMLLQAPSSRRCSNQDETSRCSRGLLIDRYNCMRRFESGCLKALLPQCKQRSRQVVGTLLERGVAGWQTVGPESGRETWSQNTATIKGPESCWLRRDGVPRWSLCVCLQFYLWFCWENTDSNAMRWAGFKRILPGAMAAAFILTTFLLHLI